MVIRRVVASVASVAAFGLALLVPTAANAGPGNSDFGHSHRVCADPAPGAFACDAYVVDDARTLQPLATATFVNGYSATQLQNVYGPFGTGNMTIAIVDAYAHPNAEADLVAYRAAMSLPALTAGQFVQYNQNGGSISTVTGNTGWGQEEMLDLEMASAMCPTCNLIYVGGNSASFADLSAAVGTAKTKDASVISNSYGAKEFRSETLQTAWNILGVAVTVSSGDSGYGVQFPAASAKAIAVGGTNLTLNTDGSRKSETVWSGAGSGCSSYIGKPDWQLDTSCGKRTVADVAAVADPATGVAVYDSYGSTGGLNWYVFGGTSVAAPIIAGVIARSSTAFGSTEDVAQRFYTYKGRLFDVTSGSNGRCATPRNKAAAYLCNGVVGYDGPTGNGTPSGTLGTL